MRSYIMNEYELNKLLQKIQEVDNKISFFINKKILAKQEIDKNEIRGHIAKSAHNLNFVNDIKNKDYNDWILVVCYYASYHIALALILSKGYYSKNHDATLSVLIKYFYKNLLNKEDIKLLNEFILDTQDILFYVESKEKREKASYSTKINFDNKTINEIKIKTILFINKARAILEDDLNNQQNL